VAKKRQKIEIELDQPKLQYDFLLSGIQIRAFIYILGTQKWSRLSMNASDIRQVEC
jgi:hypothetical protein